MECLGNSFSRKSRISGFICGELLKIWWQNATDTGSGSCDFLHSSRRRGTGKKVVSHAGICEYKVLNATFFADETCL